MSPLKDAPPTGGPWLPAGFPTPSPPRRPPPPAPSARPPRGPPPGPRSLFRRPRNEAADSAPVARKEEFSGTSLFLPKPRGVSPVECLPFHREMFGFPGRGRRPARGWGGASLPKNDSPRKGLPPSRRGYGGRRAAPSPNGM